MPPDAATHSRVKQNTVNTQPTTREININELTSISALISYVAFNRGEPELRIEQQLTDRFKVDAVTHLPSTAYEDAIRYLVDSVSHLDQE